MDKVGQKQLCGLEDDADETEIHVNVNIAHEGRSA